MNQRKDMNTSEPRTGFPTLFAFSGNNRLYIQQNLTSRGLLKQPAAGMIGDDISVRIQDALLLAL